MKTIRIKELFQSHTKRFRRFDLTGNGLIGGRYIPQGDEVQDVIEVEVKPRLMSLKLVLKMTQRKGNLPIFFLNWPQMNHNDKEKWYR